MTLSAEFSPTLRVMVVDDSPIARRLLVRVLSRSEDVEVVAELDDGTDALKTALAERVDILVLDLDMPELDGRAVLKELAAAQARFGVVVYTGADEDQLHDIRETTGRQLACEILSKGSDAGGGVDRLTQELIPMVRKLGRLVRSVQRSKQNTHLGGSPQAGSSSQETRAGAAQKSRGKRVDRDLEAASRPPLAAEGSKPSPGRIGLVVMGASTGGPDALLRVLRALPSDFPVPVAIVQHMPIGFTAQLASRLNSRCEFDVREAMDGERLTSKCALIAPGGAHLEVKRKGVQLVARLSDAAPENSCRPSVDVLFRSSAAALPGGVLAVVLTGMGQDGLAGVEAVRQSGGLAVVQNEATSVVWGMPGAIAKAGQADEIVPLRGIASRLVELVDASRNDRRAG